MNKVKLKDLPIRTKIVKRHKKVSMSLWIITYIIFFPFAILQVINETLEILINKVAILRNELVHTIFKAIYKKEIIENEKELDEILKGERE